MLNSVEWDYFKLKDLFEIQRGVSLPIKKQSSGYIPLISSTSLNNGVSQYVKPSKQNTLYKSKSITLAINGSVGEAFYQPNDFYATGDVAVLNSEYIDRYTGLFLSTILRLEKKRYTYGRKWTISRIKSTKIRLPIDKEGNPNWEFMRDYIKNLSNNNLENLNNPQIIKKTFLIDRGWDYFRLKDLFKIRRGVALPIGKQSSGYVPLISSTSLNNGVSQYVKESDENILYSANSISVAINGSVGETFYQPTDFYATGDVAILTSTNINSYTGLFVSSVLRLEQNRYTYGRKWTISRMQNTFIRLPVDKEGSPDWKFMEDYIKSLPYTKYL